MSDQANCIQCGLCLMECRKQGDAITLTENGPVIDISSCTACGHCVAVCPTDAIENPLSPRQELAGAMPSPEDAARYLRSVRSVRCYKPETVPRDLMLRLLDIGRYPQTGINMQGVSYIVVEGREKVEELIRLFCSEVERIGPVNPGLEMACDRVKCLRETGEDGIFRDCPELIFALADKDNRSGRENAQFSLTFISLLAPTLGLGTCWAGIFEQLAIHDEFSGRVRDWAGVPEGKGIRAVMMVGWPDHKFRRLVERNPLQMQWR